MQLWAISLKEYVELKIEWERLNTKWGNWEPNNAKDKPSLGRVTNVASRVEGHETRLGGVECRTGTLEGRVQELRREQRQALNNVHQRVTNVEVSHGLFEDRICRVEGQISEVANEQHQDHEEYTNLNDWVRNVEAGEATTNNDLAAVQEKQRDMEGQMVS
jgi:chromosome segregation ATPase